MGRAPAFYVDTVAQVHGFRRILRQSVRPGSGPETERGDPERGRGDPKANEGRKWICLSWLARSSSTPKGPTIHLQKLTKKPRTSAPRSRTWPERLPKWGPPSSEPRLLPLAVSWRWPTSPRPLPIPSTRARSGWGSQPTTTRNSATLPASPVWKCPHWRKPRRSWKAPTST